MREFSTHALVLDREDVGEADAKIFLYSPEWGKITAKVRSARKPLSKLNGHLQPFNLVSVRIIDRGPHIVDALLIDTLTPSWSLRKLLQFIRSMTYEGQVDQHLWQLIKQSLGSGRVDYHQLLASQGFDPAYATCYHCQQPRPTHFSFSDHSFWCAACLDINKCSPGFIELSS